MQTFKTPKALREYKETRDRVNGFDFSALPIKIEYVGKVNDKEWPHFLYNVTFKSREGFHTIPYKCGIGHVVRMSKAFKQFNDIPLPPSIADIMHSVMSDSRCADSSFSDFCDELGYTNDSIKHLKIYQECCDMAVMLRKYFSREQLTKMETALEDY